MLDVLIVNYNTPELTEAAIRSLWKQTPEARVTVFDNSDRLPFASNWLNRLNGFYGQDKMVEVIDNTLGQIVDWDRWLEQFPDKRRNKNNWGSAKHCYSVELCMNRFPNGFILMDSDVLVKQDIAPLCDPTQAFVAEVADDPCAKHFNVLRALPMLCWINTPMLKAHGIHYFNPDKMWKLNNRHPDKWYDTGAWFLEAVEKASLSYRTIRLDDYILHYGNGSWRAHGSTNDWLEEHRKLWKPKMRYTVLSYIFGNYECLHEVEEKDQEADYIMVTDDPSLRSDTWRIVLDDRKDMGIMEKCYDVRFHPFRYAETELCVRLDSSIGIHKSLRPFIDEMENGSYDRCLMLHPARTGLTEEYKCWTKYRQYPQEQAQRCLQAVKDMGYSLDYRGLFQCTFEVVRNNAINLELNDRTLQMLHDLRTESDIERIDQTIFSAIANHFYSDWLKVLPVSENVITGGYWMTWYRHNSNKPHRSKTVIAPMMFNRPCEVWQSSETNKPNIMQNIIEPCCAERQLPTLLREQKGRAVLFQTYGDVKLEHFMKAVMLLSGDRPRTLTLSVPIFTGGMMRPIAKYMRLEWVAKLRLMTTEAISAEILQHLAARIGCDVSALLERIELASEANIPDELMAFSGTDGTVIIQGRIYDAVTPRQSLYAGIFGKTEGAGVRTVMDAWNANFIARRYEVAMELQQTEQAEEPKKTKPHKTKNADEEIIQ